MPVTVLDKARRFRALHEQKGAFVIANAWDGGSALLLASLGFQAIATSSGASALTFGRRDGMVTRKEALAQARTILLSTELPVSADLEKGYGDSPEDVAETILLAAEVGLVGGSIEDATGNADRPIYDISHATERIHAAAMAARSLSFPFTVTARAENFLHNNHNLDDTIKRLLAYEKAGADVLFAPGLPDLESVRTVCSAISKPVNFMAGIRGKSFTVDELERAGVKRISLAGSLYRAAMSGLYDAALEVKEKGTFGYLDRVMSTAQLYEHLKI